MSAPGSTAAKIAIVLVVPVVAALAVLATSLTSGDESTAAPAAVGGTAIEIKSFAFTPTPLEVKVGATVTVVNADDTAHTVTSKAKGAFDTGTLDGGADATITVSKPGTYEYFCSIHNYMRGVIRARG
jgi:plastocyanin